MPIDRKTYPSDWIRRSYFVRFVRARGRCELCGVKAGTPHPRTGKTVNLHCAHRWRDTSRSSLLDLISLCHVCHHAYDIRDNWRRRLYGKTGRFWRQICLFDK